MLIVSNFYAQTKFINTGVISYPEGTRTELINDQFFVELPSDFIFLAKPLNSDDIIVLPRCMITCNCLSASGTCKVDNAGGCSANGCGICSSSIFNPNGGGQVDIYAIMNRKDGTVTKIVKK